MDIGTPYRSYSQAELVSDALVHILALLAALIAVPVLITLTAVLRGEVISVLAVAIYGLTLITMLSSSLLYNHLPAPEWKGTLRRLDHSAIYFKIAGTYTPFALLTDTHAGMMLAGLWIAALIGTGLQVFLPPRHTRFGVMFCMCMGWAVLFVGWNMLAALSPTVLVLMVSGGLLYTMGSAFLLASHIRFHNTIWHVFVVIASLLFYIAVMLHLVQTTP